MPAKTEAAVTNKDFQIRLSLAGAERESLADSPLIAGHATGEFREKTLHSLYFDTPDMRMEQNGVAIRVRRAEDQRLLTVKRRPAGEGGHPYERQETEAEIASDVPRLELIRDTETRDLVTSIGGDGPLMPIFDTRFDRLSVPLRVLETSMMLRIDRGEIRTGCVQEDFEELELELLEGEPIRLFELALALGKAFPLRFERRSKSARGYALARGSSLMPPVCHFAKPIRLKKKMVIGDALSLVLRSGIDHMLANEACALDGRDPEGIHQMRVALRRLRTAVTLFADAFSPSMRDYLKDELGWLQGEMGVARDLDVFLDETLGPLERRRPADPALGKMDAVARAVREEGYEQAREAILGARYTALLLNIEAWLERERCRQRERDERKTLDRIYSKQVKAWEERETENARDAFGAPVARRMSPAPAPLRPEKPIPEPARHILPSETPLMRVPSGFNAQPEALDQPAGPLAEKIMTRRFRKMRKKGRALMRESAVEELHTLRIDGKKLRYSLEFFAAMYPDTKTKPFLKTLKGLQETLGSVNDAVVATDIAASLCRRISERPALENKAAPALQDGKDGEGRLSEGATQPAETDFPTSPEHLAGLALGLVEGWHAAKIEARLSETGHLWQQFDTVKPFWNPQ